MSCRALAPLLEPFMDGELGTEKVVEIEQHLTECATCVERMRLSKAVRNSVRRAVAPKAEPSEAFRSRLLGAIEAAHQRDWETRVVQRQEERGRMLSWRTILPVAAAAACTLVWASSNPPEQRRQQRLSAAYAQVEPASIDEVLERLVDHHVKGRPNVIEPELLPRFEEEVGVPVRAPDLIRYGARLEGGSVVPLRNQRAASLRYKLGAHRMTLYVYDSSRFPIEQRLKQRYVGDEAVYVGKRRGYSIGATEQNGVGYAVASDLNDEETAEILATAY